nr:esterase/lipase 16 [uncultured bacterium]
MDTLYRKYMPGAYGERAPETVLPVIHVPDLNHMEEWRHRAIMETITELTDVMRPCFCYEPIMKIKITRTTVLRDGYAIPVCIYHPEGEGPFPVMVYLHGGAFCVNNPDVYGYVCRYFARFGGILVISPDYRLAPENPFPVGLEDSYAALEWAARKLPEIGGDPARVSVCGDSSGGNFAAALCLMSRDRGGPGIYKQALIYPAVNMLPGPRPQSELRYGNGGYALDLNSEQGIVPFYFADPRDAASPYASPLLDTDHQGLPPACFITAECDPLQDHALMYAAKLEDAGVSVEYHLYTGMIHGFINRAYQKTFEALDAINRFVR